MESVLDLATTACIRVAIFEIANDRSAQGCEMHTYLVHAARHWLHGDPGKFLTGGAHDHIVGNSAASAFRVLFDHRYLFLAALCLLCQSRPDRAAQRVRNTLGQCPVDL